MNCCKIVWFQIYFPVATHEPCYDQNTCIVVRDLNPELEHASQDTEPQPEPDAQPANTGADAEPQQEPPLPALEDDLLERIDDVDDGSSSHEENLEQDLDLDNRIAEALLRDRRKYKGCLSVCYVLSVFVVFLFSEWLRCVLWCDVL